MQAELPHKSCREATIHPARIFRKGIKFMLGADSNKPQMFFLGLDAPH